MDSAPRRADLVAMSSEEKPPNPLTDLRKGLGLLFRAATTTARKLPSTNLGKELEQVVVTSAREVGRAIENVATTIEREVRTRTGPASGPKPPSDAESKSDANDPSKHDRPSGG
jgi:hypothetical protein